MPHSHQSGPPGGGQAGVPSRQLGKGPVRPRAIAPATGDPSGSRARQRRAPSPGTADHSLTTASGTAPRTGPPRTTSPLSPGFHDVDSDAEHTTGPAISLSHSLLPGFAARLRCGQHAAEPRSRSRPSPGPVNARRIGGYDGPKHSLGVQPRSGSVRPRLIDRAAHRPPRPYVPPLSANAALDRRGEAGCARASEIPCDRPTVPLRAGQTGAAVESGRSE